MTFDFKRADPSKLAEFDPSTKRRTMNCGPHELDPRSRHERQFLCEDCEIVKPNKPKFDMNVTREQAIKIIDHITNMNGAGFDDWWPDMMDDFGLYDETTDKFPSIYDVFNALGVSKEECQKAGV